MRATERLSRFRLPRLVGGSTKTYVFSYTRYYPDRAGYSQRRESDLDQLEALLWISYEMGTVFLPHTYS